MESRYGRFDNKSPEAIDLEETPGNVKNPTASDMNFSSASTVNATNIIKSTLEDPENPNKLTEFKDPALLEPQGKVE